MRITFMGWSSQWHPSIIMDGHDYKVGTVRIEGRKKGQLKICDAVKGRKSTFRHLDWVVEVMEDNRTIAAGHGDTEVAAENAARLSIEQYIRKHGWGRKA